MKKINYQDVAKTTYVDYAKNTLRAIVKLDQRTSDIYLQNLHNFGDDNLVDYIRVTFKSNLGLDSIGDEAIQKMEEAQSQAGRFSALVMCAERANQPQQTMATLT